MRQYKTVEKGTEKEVERELYSNTKVDSKDHKEEDENEIEYWRMKEGRRVQRENLESDNKIHRNNKSLVEEINSLEKKEDRISYNEFLKLKSLREDLESKKRKVYKKTREQSAVEEFLSQARIERQRANQEMQRKTKSVNAKSRKSALESYIDQKEKAIKMLKSNNNVPAQQKESILDQYTGEIKIAKKELETL